LGTLTTEPLAVTYVYGEDETESDTWRFFEQYVGRDGFDAHCRTPHFAKWEEFASTGPFVAPPEVRFFAEDSADTSCLGSRMVRDALVAFGGDGYHATARLFCLDVRMTVRPEKRDAFLAALRADQRGAVTSEPNAVSYLFGEDATTPNVFHMFEAYSGGGRGGFEEHARTEHYGKWAEFKIDEEPFSSPPGVGYYEIQLPYGVSS
jgi:quinol monooxygenase YgiN